MNKQITQWSGISLVIIVFVWLAFGITVISPGEVGLQIRQIAIGDEPKGILPETLDTGTYWVNPITMDVKIYDTRFHQYNIPEMPSSTNDGQKVEMDVSLEIGLIDQSVPKLHETIGPNWYEQVVYPAARAAARAGAAFQSSDDIYTGKGRIEVQKFIENYLVEKLEPYGIRVSVNLRDIRFLNEEFRQILERKARAAQEIIIAEREAAAAAQRAIKVANIAEGQKQKSIKEAEAERERLRLKGEGERLQQQERAKGILAVAQAEAEGIRLKNRALMGPGGKNFVSIRWAEEVGKNISIVGVPTGAPGTAAFMDLNGMLRGIMPQGVGKE